jgi:hypothetical protein
MAGEKGSSGLIHRRREEGWRRTILLRTGCSYFFLVFAVAFLVVFFVVPHAAPFGLQAIENPP